MTVQELDKAYVANTYNRFPVTLTSGNGAILTDENGKEYIDMGTGIAVNTFGNCDSEWISAIEKQLHSIGHTSNLYYTEPCAKLAQMLCERTGMKKVFFSNSGAEANECAIKAARKYAFNKYGDESHSTIITLVNSFHGRTVTTLAATGQDVFHKEFGPFTEGFKYAEVGNLEALDEMAKDGCSAIMFEIVQGEGGVLPLSEEFVHGIFAIAKKYDLLTICDEVQCGNGRSGELYAYMNYGVVPDIVSTAKGLCGGLPMGATMLGEKVADVYTPGSHGSTFGGNPICAAGAINVLSRIDGKLLSEIKEKSAYIKETLTGKKGIKGVSGLGLMLGVETEKPAAEVVKACRENGVLVLTAKTKVRLLPPLNIDKATLAKAVEIIAKCCE